MRRFKRFRSNREGRRGPVNVLASVLTTLGLYFGVTSIFASISDSYTKAAYLILGAIVFDILDGSVAKATNSTSEFGKQLDSLADLVSFGVAPAVLIYTAFLQEGTAVVSKVGSVFAILFAICGALRLARYNVYQSGRRDIFVGLPIPAAGGTVAAFVIFTEFYQLKVAFWVLGPITLALAYLMISTVRYPKDKLKAYMLAPRPAIRILAVVAVVIALVHFALEAQSPAVVLLPLAAAYVLFGVGDTVYSLLRRRTLGHIDSAENGNEKTTLEQGEDI